MKKTLLTLFSAIAVSLSTSAQIEIYVDGGTTDLSGGEYHIDVTSNSEVHTALNIHNMTGSDKAWTMTRYKMNIGGAWADYMCWGSVSVLTDGQCYSVEQMVTNPWTSPDAWNIPNMEEGLVDSYVTPDVSVSNVVTYRYYVGTDGNTPTDSIDLVFHNVLAVADLSNQISLSIAPNPSNDVVTVTVNEQQTGVKFTLVDVLGNVILTEEMTIATTKIDVSKFNNGIYFLTVEAYNAKPTTQKIIVRH